MNIAVIGDQHTLTAFRLAGIKKIYTAESGRDNLRTILDDASLGVLIVTERFAEENKKAIEDHKSSKKLVPIVVEVPDISGPIEREVDPIRELIRRAIGADVTQSGQ